MNWALRQIGKRNLRLNKASIRTARAIQKLDSAAARWIAADALRELKSDAVQKRLQNRAGARNETKSGSEIGKTLSSIECTSGCLV